MSRIIGRTNEVYSDEVPEIIFLQVIDASTRSIVSGFSRGPTTASDPELPR